MASPTHSPPFPLSATARDFWDRHNGRLRAAGVLTDADVESFLLLCQVWGKLQALDAVAPGPERYREMIQYTNLSKQYFTLARQFGLLPRERKAAKMETEPAKAKDEFGFDS